MTEPAKTGPAPRPRLISGEDFTRLMWLAYHDDPTKALIPQVAHALDVADFTVKRWMEDKVPPPEGVIKEAMAKADTRAADAADLLDRVTKALK